MHDLLVSYLLGECGDEQRQRVEEALRRDPKLRRQLEHIRNCIGCPDDATQPELPPCGLAERTAQRVSHLADGDDCELGNFSSIGFTSDSADAGGGGAASWSVVDMVVAAGVVLAIGMLLAPALRESRSAARRTQCEHHLQQLGKALVNYATYNHRYFPVVHPQENAGMYAVRLVDGGYIDAREMQQLIVCPSAPLADELATGQVVIWIPSFAELQSIHGTQRFKVQRLMGGSYAYRFGYIDNGRYYGVRNDFNSRIPVLADAPRITNASFQSCNHGGGQNVLFQDLSVKYLKGFLTSDGKDHLFLNAHGLHAAGIRANDCVLGRSEAKPGMGK
jgi:hypothetical protein